MARDYDDKQKGFVLYKDSQIFFDKLTDEDAGKLIKAIFAYAVDGDSPDRLPPVADMAFTCIRQYLDRDSDKYRAKCEVNALNGSKGGKARQANASERKRTLTTASDRERNQANQANKDINTNTDININNNTNMDMDSNSSSTEQQPPQPPESDVFFKILLSDGEYSVTHTEVESWEKLYPGIDVKQEFRSMAGWCEVNPDKRKTRKEFKGFASNWLMRTARDNPKNDRQDDSMDAFEDWMNGRHKET